MNACAIARSCAGLLAGALFLIAAPVRAMSEEENQFQVFLENDILARTDRYYTNGFKFGGGQPASPEFRDFMARLLRYAPGEGDNNDIGLFFGQNMYTPKDISIAAPQPYDRPWGAFLYGGAVVQRAHKGPNDRVDALDTIEIDAGVIGPAALGGDVQKAVHRWTGSRTPMGWGNQAPTEPAVLAAYLHKEKLAGNDYFDVIGHGGVTAGTVMALGRVGGVARIGYGLSGFGVDTIEPGGALLQSTRSHQIAASRTGFEAYAFAGVDQRLVLYNIFLDGPVFHDGPSVERRPHVYDLLAGASVRWGPVRLSLTRVRRSEEFYTVVGGGGGKQIFHSINLGFEW